MKQIAEMAAVSPTVVSAVVRGDEPRIFVSESTRERVLQIAKETGYQPRRRRQQDLASRVRRIALISSEYHLTVFSAAVAEMSRVLNERECMVGIHLGNSAEQRWQIAAALHEEKQAQAAILLGSTELPEWAYSAPVVILGEVPPEDAHRAWSVRLDNTHAGQMVADYLWHLGHRCVGIAGALTRTWAEERIAAFRSKWESYGGEFSDNCIFDFWRQRIAWGEGEPLAAKLGQFLQCAAADGGPLTALFCMNDYQAAVTIRALRHLGYRVPQDVSIVGVDDRPDFPTALDPQLTTVRQPFPSLGRIAAELLLERLDGQRKPRQVVLPGELIERDSCLAVGE